MIIILVWPRSILEVYNLCQGSDSKLRGREKERERLLASFSLIIIVPYIQTHKYMNTTCWDHLVLLAGVCFQGWPHNRSGGSSLGQTFSLLSSHELPLSLELGVGISEVSVFHANMSVGIITVPVLFRQDYCLDFVGVASMPFLENRISTDFVALGLRISVPLLRSAPRTRVVL